MLRAQQTPKVQTKIVRLISKRNIRKLSIIIRRNMCSNYMLKIDVNWGRFKKFGEIKLNRITQLVFLFRIFDSRLKTG